MLTKLLPASLLLIAAAAAPGQIALYHQSRVEGHLGVIERAVEQEEFDLAKMLMERLFSQFRGASFITAELPRLTELARKIHVGVASNQVPLDKILGGTLTSPPNKRSPGVISLRVTD